MKKLHLLFVALCLPFAIFAQQMDTVNVLFEDFDDPNATCHMSTSYVLGGMDGDWRRDATLYSSAPYSFHSPVYTVSQNSQLSSDAISLEGTSLSQVNRVYLYFDHICKVSQRDQSYLCYSLGYIDQSGNYQWATPQTISFTETSDFYYGDAVSVTGGKFSDNMYGTATTGTWNPNNMSAVPNNTWWRHEYFDISQFVLGKTITVLGVSHPVTHFRIIFRTNKSSTSTSGTEACAGWYVDNVKCVFSNCELVQPKIELQPTVYVNKNNSLLNNIGPYTIKAKITDNDTLNVNSLAFTYSINSGAPVTVPNNITSNTRPSGTHQLLAQWDLPSICYYDTIRYHIGINDVHGSTALPIDTPLIAWHNQTNIHQNDCHLDSLNTFPHCFITGVAEPVTVYFKNKSDAVNSLGGPYQTGLNVTLKVENENHQQTHSSSHDWTGSLCFDERDNLSLGTFTPTHGFNYITVYINTRNGQPDGFHGTGAVPTTWSDTIRVVGYACDSLLHGDYTVGGTNPDFASMNEVKAALSYCGVNGPTTFHLRPGTYQDFDFRTKYEGVSATNTITFQGDNANTVIVTNNHPDTNNNIYGAVTLIGVDNIYFKNLKIQGATNAVSRAVVLRGNGSRNIVFDGCNIVANPTNSTANTSFALGRATAAAATAGQPAVSDTVTIRNCRFTGGNYGIYYMGSTARRNQLTIQDNDITSCYKGIYTNYCNSLVKGNHVKQIAANTHMNFTGINVEQTTGIDIDGNTIDSTFDVEYGILLKTASVNDFYVRNNHVLVGNSNFGIDIESSNSSATDTGYIYNNEVILYPVTAAASYAVQIKSCNGLKLTNNSFYVKSDAPYSNTAALRIENNNNTFLNNNILLNYTNCSDNTNYPLYLNGTSSFKGTYNDLISASGVIAYKTVARNTIEELESAVNGTNNFTSHNISVLPPIADPTSSLLPTDFTGLECGKNMDVATDIRGTERTDLTYMGAYANQIAATDAAVVAMTNPASGTCPQGSYNITVSIANKGSQALNFASHNATVTVHSDTLNLTQTANINTGSIPVLGSISKVIANNIAIPVNQTIDFTFIIHTNGDANYLNDTLRTFFVLEAAVPDYEEDFSNGTKQTWTIMQTSTSGAGNWTFQEGTGVNPAIAPVYGTGRLFFNSKAFANNTESRAIMPVVDLANSVNPILEVWFAHDNTANKTAEGVTVKISTDGGTTFNAINPQGQNTSLLKRYLATATTPQWTLYTYDLSNYVSSGCVYIAFDAKSQQGNNINIDRIRLRNLCNNDVAVTNVYAQGETPAQYSLDGVVKAMVRNEGRQTQNNVKVYLNVTGSAEQYHDSLTVASLASGAETIVTFPLHHYNVTEVKNVEVRSRNDENNANNASNWRMVTTQNVVNYADTSAVALKTGDYTAVIRPCVRYRATDELVVSAVKYYYDQSYIANPSAGFRAFVANAAGNIVATSDLVNFNDLTQGDWNIIPINNFALSNMHDMYVGIEMLANGDYLCSQVETPLRDSTFYYLNNGVYEPQTFGRFMIGAVIDTPHVHDFAILDLQNPTTRCDLGHEQITVGITNNGSQDIPAGTVLKYSVNGASPVSETLTMAIPSHATTNYAFNTIYDFTNNQVNIDDNYNIKVWVVKDAQDRLQYNDTLNMTISSLGKSATPILAQDTVNVNYYTTGTLTATMPSSISEGVFGWFTNSGYEQWNLLTYGNTYTTPVTFFDTVYYVNANPGSIHDTIVGTGTLTGAQPFIFTNGYSRGRSIYDATEIGHNGMITQIGLYVNNAATGQDGIPIKLYMKQTDMSLLPTAAAAVDWASETASATLVYDGRIFFNHTGWFYIDLMTPFEYTDGNLIVMTETNCADYCTGTGSQCNNCGQYVSGSTGYPVFRQTQLAGGSQYKSGNTLASLESNYTAYNRRLNMSFRVVDLECGSEKVPIYVHVPDIPTYDVKTMSMDYPTYEAQGICALYDENIQVSVKNLLNVPIPANKVMVHAIINGTHLTQLITEPFASEELKTVTFTTPYNFASPGTTNTTFNYTIYTDMPDEAVVYRGNDTITGSVVSKGTAGLQASYTYTGEYSHDMEILQVNDRLPMTGATAQITKYLFYNDATTTTPITLTPATAQFYTTPVLYDSVTYWVAAITKTTNCTTRRVPIYINVFSPQYDLITNGLTSPNDYQCGLATSPQIQVNVGNLNPTSSNVIPAGTFGLTADFTGSSHVTGNTTISTPISSMQNQNVAITINNMSSTTQNRTYQYTIYSDPTNSNMPVYRNNDTITGVLHVPANPTAPQALTFTAPYGLPYTITPNNSTLDYYYFYENANGDAIGQGTSYTTEPIYGTTTYYYSGRIEDPDFAATVQVGTGTVNNAAPFNTAQGHSYAKILYSASEVGPAGRIDTIKVNVLAANTSGVGIPVKIWLKNGADAECLTAASLNWANETNGAKLVFDGELKFDQVGWVAIPVPGGFDYTGAGLYMYTEHNCGDNTPCTTGLGVNPEPKFQNSQYTVANQKKTLQKVNATAITNVAFSLINFRWNTQFKFNYTCESPKSTITINTSMPQHDVGVVDILRPVQTATNRTATEQVQVTIKNFGSAAASNFPVSYRFNNGTPVTQNFTGTIAAGATANMTFTQTVDLTDVYYCLPFAAYTDMSGDSFHGNDTLTVELCNADPCISQPTATLTDGADISNVTFAGINNGTGTPYVNYPLPAGCNGLYTDYTNLAPAQIVKGQVYPLSVTHSFTTATGATVYKKVYIDYNRDGDFSDADECVFTSPAVPYAAGGANATTTTNITIPTTATLGLTRMRVICAAGALNNNNSPCGIYNYRGETEDYAVEIMQPHNKDLGILSYVHPVGDVCPDTNAKIRVLIKNFGTEAQSFNATNEAVLTTVVTGPVPGTYTTSLSSGTMMSGESYQCVMNNVNFSIPGSYRLVTTLTYNGDTYAMNDTMSIVAQVMNTAIAPIPYGQNFDDNNNEDANWLPAGWSLENSNNNYKWKVYSGSSPNSGSGAGPTHDHTYPNSSIGHFAAVANANVTTYRTQYTALTSGCVNLHYHNGYPIEVAFYQYFLGANNADFIMTVEAGSGSYYVPVDTVTKADGGQTSVNSDWSRHVSAFNDYDEVGRIRFKVTDQHYRIDASIDDVSTEYGLPDLAVESIEYPYDFRDTVEHPDPCLVVGDTIYPRVVLRNNGYSQLTSFDVIAIMQVGMWKDTIVEHINEIIRPNSTFEYTFTQGFELYDIGNVQFSIYCDIPYDKNHDNDTKRVITCTNSGIDDYEVGGGMVLYQNIPNPANTTTKILYLLAEPSKTTLNIYSTTGQLVYSDSQDAYDGNNYYEVNVANFADGIYYYKVTSATGTLTKKMVIQK